MLHRAGADTRSGGCTGSVAGAAVARIRGQEMRWKKEPLKKDGTRRTVTRFLFSPLLMRGETRWLERANIIQRYTISAYSGMAWWADWEWADDEEGK